MQINIDFETYSELDLKVFGAWAYSLHPSTEILCLSYRIDQEPIERWIPWRDGRNCPERLSWAIRARAEVHAFNAAFERCIWENLIPKDAALRSPKSSTESAASEREDPPTTCRTDCDRAQSRDQLHWSATLEHAGGAPLSQRVQRVSRYYLEIYDGPRWDVGNRENTFPPAPRHSLKGKSEMEPQVQPNEIQPRMTLSEVASIEKAAVRTVRRWVRSGKLRAFRREGRYLVTPEALLEFERRRFR